MKKWMWPLLAVFTFILGQQSSHLVQNQSPGRIPSSHSSDLEAPSRILGSTEEVWFGPNRELYFHAKIDSGAESSSIHASKIISFTKNGKTYVEFETIDDKGSSQSYIRQVSKIDEVKNSLGAHKRYFFYETVWINYLPYYAEINVTDRSHLSKRFLVGKNILKQGFLIDSSIESSRTLRPKLDEIVTVVK